MKIRRVPASWLDSPQRRTRRSKPRPGRRRGASANRETVQRWLDAFDAGDMEAAQRLYAAEGRLYTVGGDGERRGFDALVDWYAARREGSEGFGYDVHDVLATPEHVVVLFRLHAGSRANRREWPQVAVYHVRDGRITDIWLHEDAAARS